MKLHFFECSYDVLTPEDILHALFYDGGVKNTFVDYIKVNRNHRRINAYVLADTRSFCDSIHIPIEIRS